MMIAYDLAKVLKRGDRVDWRFMGEVKRRDGAVVVVDRASAYAWVHFPEMAEPCKYPICELYPSTLGVRSSKAERLRALAVAAYHAASNPLEAKMAGILLDLYAPDLAE